jgi:hypothetical protein
MGFEKREEWVQPHGLNPPECLDCFDWAAVDDSSKSPYNVARNSNGLE